MPRKIGGLMHLQFASRRRLLSKQFLYELTEVLRWPGRDSLQAINERYAYSVYGTKHRPPTGIAQFDLVPTLPEWWNGYDDLLQYLRLDAEPWQYSECQKVLSEHPGIERGLDNFGLFSGSLSAVQ